MNDLMIIFSFLLIPILCCLLLSILVSWISNSYQMKNELLLGISLPSVSSAVLAFSLIIGFHVEHHFEIIITTFLGVSIIFLLLTLSFKKRRLSFYQKQTSLMAVWCLGTVTTLFFAVLSPIVGNHIKPFLHGEVLSIDFWDLFIVLILCVILTVVFYFYRGFFFTYLIDEVWLQKNKKHFLVTSILFKVFSVFIITLSTILVGPLLTSTWLITSALYSQTLAKGLYSYFFFGMLFNFLSTFIGFVLSVLWDIPTALACCLCLFVVGFVYNFLHRQLSNRL